MGRYTAAGPVRRVGVVLMLAIAPALVACALAQNTEVEQLSLITETPEAGFDMALTLSRRGVTETQPDTEVLHELRSAYANDASSLIAVSHVVAVHSQTLAAANDYWRDAAAGDGELSLITANAVEGFDLALTLSRRGVTETQPDTDALHEQRPDYANDANLLIAASHVVAIHFQTVAIANDYWRE